jgi:hypothetical protein
MMRKVKNSLVTTSTLEFFREGKRTPGYSWLDALHGYVYARWTYLYIGIGIGEHRAAKLSGRRRGMVCSIPGRALERQKSRLALPTLTTAK